MPRPQTVPDDELYGRLAQVFRVAGFEGASLGALADGARLQRASLYHRFPEGKVQMAEAVMGWVRELFARAVDPMTSAPDVTAGVVESGRRISDIYADGTLPCVLDTLTLSGAPESVRAIAAGITASWIDARRSRRRLPGSGAGRRRGGVRPDRGQPGAGPPPRRPRRVPPRDRRAPADVAGRASDAQHEARVGVRSHLDVPPGPGVTVFVTRKPFG
jgi:AcrR family transcriptional regulator